MIIDSTFEKSNILKALQSGTLTVQGQFMESSNYTFLGKIIFQERSWSVVYKPQKGETPLWDFPLGLLCKREAAAFIISEWLGWDLVPPTVFRSNGPLGQGSVQLFVDNNPERHYFSFNEKTKERLRPAAVFDLVINNGDRKGSHILLDDHDHLWLIDHGVCFHEEDKLRTVIWDFAGQPIREDLLNDLQRIIAKITTDKASQKEIKQYLSIAELNAMQSRILRLIQLKTYPYPEKNRRVFPWPPL